MGWIADLVSTRGTDKTVEAVSNLETELDKFVADASQANHSIIEEISVRTEDALRTLDGMSIGNIHYVKDVLEGGN